MRFRRVAKDEIEAPPTTLTLFEVNAELCGRVATLALNEDNQPEMMTTQAAHPSIKDAVALACELAKFEGTTVDVYDPNGLWNEGLRQLE